MTRAAEEPDPRGVGRWIERCRSLAESSLDSVESPADDLVELAAGDRQLMERARKVILEGLERSPGDPTWTQMLAFWRRAFEKGRWEWEPSPWDESPHLTGSGEEPR